MSFLAHLDPWLVDLAISGAAGLAALVAVAAVWVSATEDQTPERRARLLGRYRSSLLQVALRPEGHRGRAQTLGLMRGVVQRFDLLRSREAERIALTLARAGLRSRDALVAYLFVKLSLPLAFGAGAAALVYGAGLWELPGMAKLGLCLGAVIAGAYAPEVYVRNAIERRRKAISKGLPDALDLLVICSEAGLAMDGALARVSRELARAAPEVADEFGLTAVELGFLPERRKALENLMRRVELPSVRGVVNTLIQTERYGTPIAQALRVLAAEFRAERLMRAEEKAARLPATLTVPLVVFILPTLFIVLLGPAVMRAIDGLSRL